MSKLAIFLWEPYWTFWSICCPLMFLFLRTVYEVHLLIRIFDCLLFKFLSLSYKLPVWFRPTLHVLSSLCWTFPWLLQSILFLLSFFSSDSWCSYTMGVFFMFSLQPVSDMTSFSICPQEFQTFKSLLHFELICTVGEVDLGFIFLHVDIQCFFSP